MTLEEEKQRLRALIEQARKLRERADQLQAKSEAIHKRMVQRERSEKRKPAG